MKCARAPAIAKGSRISGCSDDFVV